MNYESRHETLASIPSEEARGWKEITLASLSISRTAADSQAEEQTDGQNMDEPQDEESVEQQQALRALQKSNVYNHMIYIHRVDPEQAAELFFESPVLLSQEHQREHAEGLINNHLPETLIVAKKACSCGSVDFRRVIDPLRTYAKGGRDAYDYECRNCLKLASEDQSLEQWLGPLVGDGTDVHYEPSGEFRTPRYVFRSMSEEHFQKSLQEGFHQSDERNNYKGQKAQDPEWWKDIDADDEGTVGSRWPILFGLWHSPDGLGRVVKIEVNPEEEWEEHPDDEEGVYMRTFKPIPTSRFVGWTPLMQREGYGFSFLNEDGKRHIETHSVTAAVSEEDWDNPSHDYDPEWDYEVDETPHPDVVRAVEAIRPILDEASRHAGLGKPRIHFVKLDGDDEHTVAKFINGTSSHPVIVLDSSKHEGQDEEVHMSILHELGHAIHESEIGEVAHHPEDEAAVEDYADDILSGFGIEDAYTHLINYIDDTRHLYEEEDD